MTDPLPGREDPAPTVQRVNAHAARHNLAELMDRAHAGEAFLLTKYGRPWARLLPLDPVPPSGQPAAPAQRRPGSLQRLGALAQPRILLWP